MISYRLTAISAASTILALASAPAHAGFPVQIEKTCAVGGEEFTYVSTGSYTTFGIRPDGKPYGSWTFPLALPDCPTNKLVMYRDFDEDEIDALAVYLATPEFTGIHQESQYYRAAAIADHLNDRTPYTPLYLLLRATWEVDSDPASKARYQREFAERIDRLPRDEAEINWLALTARAANAWRELGEFEKATATMDSLPAKLAPEDMPDDGDYSDAAEEARFRQYLAEFRLGLTDEIAARNTDSEPLAMMSERFRVARCLELIDAGEEPIPELCQTPEIEQEIIDLRKRRAEWEAETDAIQEAAKEAVQAVSEDTSPAA